MNWMPPATVLRLGWTLLHFLWQGAAMAGILGLLLWLAKGRLPRLRHGLSCLILVAMAAAPIATWSQLGRPAIVGPATFAATATGRYEAGTAAPSSAASPKEAPVFSHAGWRGLFPLGVGLWLLGVAVMSLRLAGGWAWLQWLRRRPATVPAPNDLQLRLLRLCQRMKLASNIRILLCEKVPGPTVLGWLRPVILLPPAALLGMPPDQMELVLAHELAHILRHDFAINLLQSCVEVLLFYHPAVWWVSAKIRQERELCCDDLAVRTTGDALDYAAALTRLEALCRPPNPPRHAAQALALGATGGSFMHRIRRLISPMAPTPLAPRAGLVLLLILGGLFTLQARSPSGRGLLFSGTAQAADSSLGNRFDPHQWPPDGTMWLRRYDGDSPDGKRRAGTIYVQANMVTSAEITEALVRLDLAPADPVKGYVDLELKADLSRPDRNRQRSFSHIFLGADPVRVRRVVSAWGTFPFLWSNPKDKKAGRIILQRNNDFSPQLGLLPHGLRIHAWAGDVPVEAVLEALNELTAMTPEAGIPQEIRREIPPGSGKGHRISLDLAGKDPLELWRDLDSAVRRGQP